MNERDWGMSSRCRDNENAEIFIPHLLFLLLGSGNVHPASSSFIAGLWECSPRIFLILLCSWNFHPTSSFSIAGLWECSPRIFFFYCWALGMFTPHLLFLLLGSGNVHPASSFFIAGLWECSPHLFNIALLLEFSSHIFFFYCWALGMFTPHLLFLLLGSGNVHPASF